MAQYSTLVKLAKQGDPRAIAYLITRTLHKYGITARANLKGHCLRLLLEAEQVPHQATMVKLVSRGMQKLNATAIETVKLYGRRFDQKTPAWRQVIELGSGLLEPMRSDVERLNFEQSDFRKSRFQKTGFDQSSFDQSDFDQSGFEQSDFRKPDFEQGDFDSSEMLIFQLDDLDPDAVILLPVEPKVQLDDLDPEALILFPVDTVSTIQSDPETEPQPATLSMATPLLEEHSPSKAAASIKLPKRLTLLLLISLWLRLGIDTLTLLYALLSAGSFSLYTGLDLSKTNQPFASLLAGVVSIADFLFTPLDRIGLWINLIAIVLFLCWLHRLHASLRMLYNTYPISPAGAVARFVLPIYNLWGIGNTCFTLARRLASSANLNRASYLIRRLTVWLYLLMLLTAGLQGFQIWLLNRASTAITSLWYYVARDTVIWLLSFAWLRLVRLAWRSVRKAYQELMPLPVPPAANLPVRPSPINIKAILLGAGTSLLSLALFNSLLGVLAASVFVSNGIQSESIIPTFFDSESLLTLVLFGSFICIGLGGFLTAQLTATGLAHALGLGVFLTVIGLALQHSTVLPVLTELPFWFQTASAVLTIPAALTGGGLRQWLKNL